MSVIRVAVAGVFAGALLLCGCATTESPTNPATYQPPPPPGVSVVPAPGSKPRPAAKPVPLKSPHQQYFDQRKGRYYYFDQKTHAYYWEDGAPRN